MGEKQREISICSRIKDSIVILDANSVDFVERDRINLLKVLEFLEKNKSLSSKEKERIINVFVYNFEESLKAEEFAKTELFKCDKIKEEEKPKKVLI